MEKQNSRKIQRTRELSFIDLDKVRGYPKFKEELIQP